MLSEGVCKIFREKKNHREEDFARRGGPDVVKRILSFGRTIDKKKSYLLKPRIVPPYRTVCTPLTENKQTNCLFGSINLLLSVIII